MKHRILVLVALLAAGCASMTALQRAQQSHDFLALAQDSEINLCLGVPSVKAVPAGVAVNHCTSPAATVVGLTDAKHQQFQGLMKKALDDHAAATKLLQAGSVASTATVDADVASLLSLVSALAQGNVDVSRLMSQLKKAGH
jgi:hypothetical protein